ncbi:hypothetical protein B0H21DRAFT_824796 [Amylocystis lapponica]|nr:hypothetical protein B0H21DRAFT_824796 [Amylocystis lapponica]
MSEQVMVQKAAVQAEYQGHILLKLLIFSAALAIAPVASFFLSKKHIWDGNTTYAAITAIAAAHTVLVSYIIISVREESQAARAPKRPTQEESKKTR